MAQQDRIGGEERSLIVRHAYPAEDHVEDQVGNSRQHSQFSTLDEATRRLFLERCRLVAIEPGRSVFLQGDKHSDSYIIKSGTVRTFYVADSGREITLGHWSKGDLVGGPSIFGGGCHIWSAVATKQTQVFAITGPALRELAATNPQIYPWIIDVLSFKLSWLSILFQIHGTEHVQERLIKLLIMLGDCFGSAQHSGIIIEQKISQTDLASLVGASRQWTNKTLGHLKSIGLIAMRDGKIILQDSNGLKAMIGSQ